MEPHRRSPPTPPLLSPNSPPKYPVNSIPQKQGAVLFLDENGNPVRIDSTWYSSHYSALEIDFDAFELIGQSRSIADADAVDVATINDIDTATINIFPFLDQVYSNIAAGTEDPISFAFLFTFATPVNQSTVDIDDFNISLVDSSGSSTRLDSNNDNITFTFTDYSTGGETSSTLRYDLVDTAATNITFNSDSTVITMSFPLEDAMLYYGFDIEDQLAVALDPDNDITSATGIALGSGSEPLAYIVQAQMPLLTEFLFVDPTTEVASPDDASVNQYSTFAYSQGIDSSANFAEYYGFRLRYGFSEPIAAVQGRSDTIDYFAPDDGYYLEGAGTDLLAYQKYAPFGSADLPTSGSVYDTFFTDGSLVHPDLNDPDANTTWDHLVYLSDDEAQFESDTADHNFTIVASESKTYMSGSDITAYGASLPILLGGYDSSGGTVYTPTTKLDANFFLDAYGNPARVALDWLYGTGVEANSTLAITYDRSKPSLLSAQALETIDTDADGNADTFDGSFGTFSDEVTFEFALTFDREMDQPSLESGILWDVAISSSYALDTPTQSVSAGTPDGTNYIYTFTYSVDAGLYAASGTYAIAFNTTQIVTDTKGNELDLALANTTLADLCTAGTCQFLNNPVTLEAFTVDPGGVVVIGQDSTSAAAFNVTFTFSEPVTLNTTDTANFFFDLIYTELESGTAIESAIVLENTLQSLDPVAASDDGSGHYTEYQLSVSDSGNEHWAIDRYEDEIGVASVVSIFFEDDKFSSIGSLAAITFHSNFQSADGSLITIPPSVQSGTRSEGEDDPTAGATAMQYLISNIMPALDTATPIAADLANSQNDNPDHFDSDTPVARHVEFDFNDTLIQAYGTSVGMLMLYRTEDDQFTHTDSTTAPFYGADGGIIISGADLNANNIAHHVCPPFSDRIHGTRAGSPSPNAPMSYNPNRLKIHYLAIPYYPNNLEPIDAAGISALAPISADFSTSADYLSDTEPCVRSTFYNQGVGQYGYIVDTDREEEMMLIANAVLQDADGYNLDDARLPTTEHNNVYFDLYTRDYYNDSWQKDLTITLAQVLADLAGNIGAGSRHAIGSGVTIAFGSVDDSADDTIFASRFINTINARFLNNVFLDDLTADKIKGYDLTINEYIDSEVTPVYDAHIAAGIGSSNIAVVATSSNDISPRLDTSYISPEDTSAAALAPINQNRLVLSVGVHPASIRVDVGTSGAFNPFATDPAQLLEMDAAFYGLHYGGVAGTTKPAFDYTSRHLAYVNFDLVYELTRDATTGAITGYSLKEIVSPFTLLKTELFSSTTLGEMQANGEVYSAVAASIADNVFRLNFLGNSTNDGVGHYLPVGAYCRISSTSPSTSACYNDFAQMLLPNPSDTGTHQRNQISDHYLHRHLLRLDPEDYSPIETTETDYDLLTNFLYFSDSREDPADYLFNTGAHPSHIIDERDYSTIIYNSFSRNYGLNFSNDNLSFDTTRNMDTDYISDTSNHSDAGQNLEQSFFGLSPFAESPNARADQILPNAFFLGNQTPYDHYFHFIVKPYQHTGYTADIKADLAAADDLNLISSHIYATTGRSTSSAYYDADHLFFASQGYFMHHQAAYGIPYSSGSEVSTSSAAGPRAFIGSYYYTDRYDYQSGHHDDDAPYSHIFASAPEHYNGSTRYINLGTNSTNEEHYVYSQLHFPSLFSGRLSGMSLETTADSSDSSKNNINDFSYHKEYQHDFVDALMPAALNLLTIGSYYLENSAGGNIKLSQLDAIPVGNKGAGLPKPLYNTNNRSANVDTFSQSVYDGGRVLTPADDYDFDRGQTLARQLGFFLSEGIIFQSTNSDLESLQSHAIFSNIFLPTAPDTDVGAVGRVVDDYNSPLVKNYYPLVQASETLYTADTAYPTLVVGYRNNTGDGQAYLGLYVDELDPSENSGYFFNSCHNNCGFQFGAYDTTSDQPTTSLDVSSNSGAIYHHIPLDKIFPAGYSYQLGFINREELFMYDPAGNGDNDSAPQINRFSEAGVGSFGYATQYNRLNRRSMIEIHQGTASHFLGDHFARFQGTPSAGVHVSNDIDNPYKHTPANQGATGTNYGSYGEGHYDLTTEASASANGSTWQHRTYQGTLRGYVLEMRMNPIYTSPVYKITDTAGATGDLSLGGTFTAGTDFTDDTSTRP